MKESLQLGRFRAYPPLLQSLPRKPNPCPLPRRIKPSSPCYIEFKCKYIRTHYGYSKSKQSC
ncbi:hypothetical protein VP150E351_P0230 [Vibrio phage 150E35-1]|nr:hypothetical protein VP150E351_P0230 [Vibrio phage 150E35-1]